MGLSRNKVAVPEGAAGTPPFWSVYPYRTRCPNISQGSRCGTRRKIEVSNFTFLVYPVSEDYDMMIRRNPEAATSLMSVVVQVKVDSPIAQLVRALH